MEKEVAIPRAQVLAQSGIQTVPLEYVRSDLEPSQKLSQTQIPVIDLQDLNVPHLKEKTISKMSIAAQKWGFFQIVGHGVPEFLISRVQAVGKAFFDLPMEEKELYSSDHPGNPLGYSSKIGYSVDDKLEWGDFYYNVAWPTSKRERTKWPNAPSDFTDVMDEYGREIHKLSKILMQVLSKGLGLDDEKSLYEGLGEEKMEIHFRINYYPPCPQPELVLGLSPHSDPNAITILLHDKTPGLQIRMDGAWLDVESLPGALIVNVADALEVLSNGKYKSVEHRSLVHADRARMSWAMFCVPSLDDDGKIISPLTELIDEKNPAAYEASSWKDYTKSFFTKGLDGKGHVHHLKRSGI